MFSTLTVISPCVACLGASEAGAAVQPAKNCAARSTAPARTDAIHRFICKPLPARYERSARLMRNAIETKYMIQLTFLYCPAKSFIVV